MTKRQPRGIPVGGQFAESARAEADVAVAVEPDLTQEQLDEIASIKEQHAQEDLARRTVVIRTDRAAEAQASIDKANRRLEREGIAESFTVDREDTVERREPTPEEIARGDALPGQMIEIRTTKMVLNRPRIGREGWKFDAALDRIPGTDVFTMRSAGREFGGWRPEPGRCDHCGQYRDRNKTFLVSNPETGETMQVGSSCMESFLGVKPEGLWSLEYDLPADLEDSDDMGGGVSYGAVAVTDNRVLIARALAVTDGGKTFLSKSRAQEYGRSSTSDEVSSVFNTDAKTESQRKIREEAEKEAVRYLHDGTVDEVLAAARSLDKSSDYGRNMHDLLDAEFVPPRGAGTIISALAVYSRSQRDKAKKELDAERVKTAAAGFLGKKQDRLREIPVTVTGIYDGVRRAFSYPYRDEPYQVVTMRTADNHEVVWYETDGERKIGDTGMLTGTISKLSQYNGVDQTTVNRAKLEKPLAEIPRDGRGFPKASQRPAGKALRKGSKVDQKARIDEIEPFGDGEYWVMARTESDNVVGFTVVGDTPPVGSTVHVDGKVVGPDEGEYQGFRGVKAYAVDASAVQHLAAPDPDRRPNIASPRFSRMPIGKAQEPYATDWAVVIETHARVEGDHVVTMRTRDNQQFAYTTDQPAEVGAVGSVAGTIRHVEYVGIAVMDDGTTFTPSGETYTKEDA